jgi:hypothetical protein
VNFSADGTVADAVPLPGQLLLPGMPIDEEPPVLPGMEALAPADEDESRQ